MPQIDCASEDCSVVDIDASSSTNLTIDCTARDFICKHSWMKLKCPSGDAAQCNVICDGYGACVDSTIALYADPSARRSHVSIDCSENRIGCGANIDIQMDSIASLSLNGANGASGYGVDISVTGTIVDSIDIACFGDYACYYMDFTMSVEHINTIHISASGDRALRGANLDASETALIDSVEIDCAQSTSSGYECLVICI